MRTKTAFTKKDIIVILGCVVFLLANLGAIGGGARRRAKEAVCLSNLYQWGTVFQMYTNDNDGYFNRGWPPSGESDGFGGGHMWPLTLEPYYSDKRLRFCPMATKTYSQGAPVKYAAWQTEDEVNPVNKEYIPQGSYGTNEWTGNNPEERIEGANWKTPNVAGADNIPLILDSWWVGGFPEDTDEPPPYEGWITLGRPEMCRFCINRHRGAVNGCFVDFSARKIGLKQLWTLKWHCKYDTCGPWTKCGGVHPMDWPEWMRNFKDY